jgi:hypothetical protein
MGMSDYPRGEPSPLRVSRPMKRSDGRVVLGKELRMPDKHARAIPQLEAFEKVLALGKQRMSLCNRLYIREFGELVDVCDMSAANEIAPHDCGSQRDRRPATYCCSVTRPFRLSLTGSESTHGGDVEELDMESAGFGQSATVNCRSGESRPSSPCRVSRLCLPEVF